MTTNSTVSDIFALGNRIAEINDEDTAEGAVRDRYGNRFSRIASGISVRGTMESLTDDEQNLFSYLAGITTSETLSLYNQDLIAVFDSEARIPHANLFPIHTPSGEVTKRAKNLALALLNPA